MSIERIKEIKKLREERLEKLVRIEASKVKGRLKEVDKKQYYRLMDAAKKIGAIYCNSGKTHKTTYKVMSEWIEKGLMGDKVIQEPNKCFIDKKWVDEFVKTKKYKINDAVKILGIGKKVLYRKLKLDEKDKEKIIVGKLPSGINYISEKELLRQGELLMKKKKLKGKPGLDRAYTEFEKFMILKRAREVYED